MAAIARGGHALKKVDALGPKPARTPTDAHSGLMAELKKGNFKLRSAAGRVKANTAARNLAGEFENAVTLESAGRREEKGGAGGEGGLLAQLKARVKERRKAIDSDDDGWGSD